MARIVHEGQEVQVDVLPGQTYRLFTPTRFSGGVNKGTAATPNRTATIKAAGEYVDPTPPPPPVDPPPPPPPPATGLPPLTDLDFIAHTVPPLPAIGVRVVNQRLGTTTIRLTSGVTHDYAKSPVENRSGKLALVGNQILDAATGLYVKSVNPPGNANWSSIDDDRIWGSQDESGTLQVLTVSTGKRSDGPKLPWPVSIGKGEGALSDNEIVGLIRLGTPYIVVYDLANSREVRTINVGREPDNCTMSHDGRFLFVDYGSGADESGTTKGTLGKGLWVWDMVTGEGRQLLVQSRHGDAAIDAAGRQCWVTVFGAGGTIAKADATVVGAYPDGTVRALLPKGTAFQDGHVSGRSKLPIVVLSDYGGQPGRDGDDQAIVLPLDFSGKVRVFAFTNLSSFGYNDQPRAVPSRDGRNIWFRSPAGSTSVHEFKAGVAP